MSDFDFDKIVSDNGGVIPKNKVYNANEWYITVRLSDFLGSRVETLEDEDGIEKEYVCIPLKHNGITRTSRNNIQCTFKATVAERATERYSHVLQQVMEKEDYQYRRELGYKVPLIGHMRTTSFKKK